MQKSPHQALPKRAGIAMLAMAALGLGACDSDATDPFPSNRQAVDLGIYALPADAPFVLVRGQTLQLLGVPMDDQENWVDMPVTWSTSNASVATVSADGMVTAVGNVNTTNVDTVTITASAGGLTATESVVIRRFPAVATVAISNVTPFLTVGETRQLTAQALDVGGVEIEGRDLEWRSSTPGVATVSQTGLVTIVGSGSTTISAIALEDGEEIVGTRTVTSPPVLAIGQTITAPTIDDGAVGTWVFVVPAGTGRLTVQIGNSSSGDADMYLYPPNTAPATVLGAGWVCRPWEWGSDEICEVENPQAGTWGLRVHAYPGEGNVAGLNMVVRFD